MPWNKKEDDGIDNRHSWPMKSHKIQFNVIFIYMDDIRQCICE